MDADSRAREMFPPTLFYPRKIAWKFAAASEYLKIAARSITIIDSRTRRVYDEIMKSTDRI